jgi:hypothetical protein
MNYKIVYVLSFLLLLSCTKEIDSPESVFMGYLETLQKTENAGELAVYFSAKRKDSFISNDKEQLRLAKAFQQISNPIVNIISENDGMTELEFKGDHPGNPDMITNVEVSFIVEANQWKIDDMKWSLNQREKQ